MFVDVNRPPRRIAVVNVGSVCGPDPASMLMMRSQGSDGGAKLMLRIAAQISVSRTDASGGGDAS